MFSESSDLWFYRTLGEEFGPVTTEALIDLVQSGQLDAQDEIRSAAEELWLTAAEFESQHIEVASAYDLDTMLIEEEKSPDPSGGLSIDNFTIEAEAGPAPALTPVPENSSSPWQVISKTPKWYCRINGQQLGPFDLIALTRMVDAGTLAPTDRVRLEDDLKWITADGIDGLFEGVAIPVATRTGHLAPHSSSFAGTPPSSSALETHANLVEPVSQETVIDRADTDSDVDLSARPSRPRQQPAPGKRGKKQGPGKSRDRVTISTDDIADILSAPTEEDEEVSDDRSRRPEAAAAVLAAARESRVVQPPPSYSEPPVSRPVYSPPPPPPRPVPRSFTPPRRSSSPDMSWLTDLFRETKTLGILAAVVLLPLLWYFSPALLGGKRLSTDEKNYLAAERIYMSLVQEGPQALKAAASKTESSLKQLESATAGKGSPVASKLHEVATKHFPEFIASDPKEYEKAKGVLRDHLRAIKKELR